MKNRAGSFLFILFYAVCFTGSPRQKQADGNAMLSTAQPNIETTRIFSPYNVLKTISALVNTGRRCVLGISDVRGRVR